MRGLFNCSLTVVHHGCDVLDLCVLCQIMILFVGSVCVCNGTSACFALVAINCVFVSAIFACHAIILSNSSSFHRM